MFFLDSLLSLTPFSNLSENPVGSTFKIYQQSRHFSASPSTTLFQATITSPPGFCNRLLLPASILVPCIYSQNSRQAGLLKSSFRVRANVLTVAYKVWHDLSLSPIISLASSPIVSFAPMVSITMALAIPWTCQVHTYLRSLHTVFPLLRMLSLFSYSQLTLTSFKTLL